MPRYFKPKAGFQDKTVKAIKIDENGFSHHVGPDGHKRLAAHSLPKQAAVSTWSLTELLNLVKGGAWVECEPPPTPSTDNSNFKTTPIEEAVASVSGADGAKGDNGEEKGPDKS